jgi:glycosyltransferase involved in cell wall biosynthesis
MGFEPLVSIVMNCYNSDLFLKEAIDSVYAQTYSNWEIVFWDNASTDESATIAKSYDQQLRYFLAENNTPLGEARNLALKKVSGKYVSFLDCDDLYLPEKLESQVRQMEGGDYSMCYGGVIVIDEDGSYKKKNKIKDKAGFLLRDLLLHYEINMQTVMIRASILQNEHIFFDTSLKFSPDYDLFMRIAVNHNVCSISDYLVKYRKRGDSLTNKLIDHIGPEMEFTLNKIKAAQDFPDDLSAEFDTAMRMVNFYRALPYIEKSDYSSARKYVRKSNMMKKKIFLCYLLLFFPVNSKLLMRLIMR